MNTPISISLNRSKSLYIRYLIACFLQHDLLLPVAEEEAEDVKITARALSVIKENREKREETVVDIGDCGAAYRFLTALLSITPGNWLLTGSKRVLQRPLLPLVDSLRNIGTEITIDDGGIVIKGKSLTANQMSIDCSKSSQFASALLLISKNIGLQELEITPPKPPSSPYIEMTRKVVEEVSRGVSPSWVDNIERDWSNAAFWYAVVALNGCQCCLLPGLRLDSLQGDSVISQWFSYLGVETVETSEGIRITQKPKKLPEHPLAFDLSNNPDLAPVMGAFAVLKPIEMRLTGLENLNFKESKRLHIMVEELSRFAEIDQKEQGIIHIFPTKPIREEYLKFHSYHDHRFIMAFMLFALDNEIEIDEISSVKKSYPGFENDIMNLGI